MSIKSPKAIAGIKIFSFQQKFLILKSETFQKVSHEPVLRSKAHVQTRF